MLKELLATGLIISGISSGALGFNHTQLPDATDATYIIHAGGEYDGTLSTNSYEALVNSYENGNRLIEIDFNFTEWMEPVCIHDFNRAIIPGYVTGDRLTHYQFMTSKIYGKYSPMDLEMLAEYMREHEDLYIVTDSKEFGTHLAQSIKKDYSDLLNRFIVQVYSEEEYREVKSLGFDKIIYTLYRLSWEEKMDTEHLIEFAKQNHLFAYTFPYELCDIDGYVDSMKKSGVPLYIHTLNDRAEIQKYLDMGINGVYTDNTTHK